jgi:hypothetical protein
MPQPLSEGNCAVFAGEFSGLGFGVLEFIGGSGLVVVAAGVAGVAVGLGGLFGADVFARGQMHF